jgi:hypothetical protein
VQVEMAKNLQHGNAEVNRYLDSITFLRIMRVDQFIY